VDRGEEIPGGFVITGRDGAELFEFAEEILDEMARLVSLFVVIALDFAVFLWRDHRRLSCRAQRFDDALVGVEGFVRQQSIGPHPRQQRVGALQIMVLARRQQERKRIAQRVNESMDFGAQPAFAAPYRLVFARFF
jgi:hypothetical protein